jgi:AraC-like DNA-binding protein
MAEEFLTTTEITIAAIARRVGYDSDEAFSRSFKRTHGRSPSLWRASHLDGRHIRRCVRPHRAPWLEGTPLRLSATAM